MSKQLKDNQLSLDPYGRAGEFVTLSDGRQILDFVAPRPELTDDWQTATLVDGTIIEVRRSACGLGCRCGGEYRFLGEHHLGIITEIEGVLDNNEGDAFETLDAVLRFLLALERLIPTDTLELIEDHINAMGETDD